MELLERLAANDPHLTELESRRDVPLSVGIRTLAAALGRNTTLKEEH
jgi:hypothetical protein